MKYIITAYAKKQLFVYFYIYKQVLKFFFKIKNEEYRHYNALMNINIPKQQLPIKSYPQMLISKIELLLKPHNLRQKSIKAAQ